MTLKRGETMTMSSFVNHHQHNHHQQHSNNHITNTGLSLNLAVVGSKGAGKSGKNDVAVWLLDKNSEF